ncbi:hypothetical protein RRG08_029364 [Elysia crispata]|uniref:Uncharacterized protein n=1 Tax=Elysia crispata TaxID=231223 RepID=A0AAE1EB39_9GAST|nr:hypothetical protein RRG08_029364 [Elysia crispata]
MRYDRYNRFLLRSTSGAKIIQNYRASQLPPPLSKTYSLVPEGHDQAVPPAPQLSLTASDKRHLNHHHVYRPQLHNITDRCLLKADPLFFFYTISTFLYLPNFG